MKHLSVEEMGEAIARSIEEAAQAWADAQELPEEPEDSGTIADRTLSAIFSGEGVTTRAQAERAKQIYFAEREPAKPVARERRGSALVADATLAAIFGDEEDSIVTKAQRRAQQRQRAKNSGVLCPHCGKAFPASCSC